MSPLVRLRNQPSVGMHGLNKDKFDTVYGTQTDLLNWDIGDPLQIWRLKRFHLHSSEKQYDLLLPLGWIVREGVERVLLCLWWDTPFPWWGLWLCVHRWKEGAASMCRAIAVFGWDVAIKEEEEEKGETYNKQDHHDFYNDPVKHTCQILLF